MGLTPYAVLLVKPNDLDVTIKKAYWAIAQEHHPDACGGEVDATWYEATQAYSMIKTAHERAAWEARESVRARRCTVCEGVGVKGTRMFKGQIKLCGSCQGEGVD